MIPDYKDHNNLCNESIAPQNLIVYICNERRTES